MVRVLKQLVPIVVLAALLGAGYYTRASWMPWFIPVKKEAASVGGPTAPTDQVVLTDQAITNLNITAQPLIATTYWKKLTVPGMVVDRPGQSDRSVSSPIMGIIQKIHHLPGESVTPGKPLFALKLLSETIHQTQSELYKSQQSIKLAVAQRERYIQAGNAIPEVRLLDINQQITRLENAANAARQELSSRGFRKEQIDAVAEGQFVQEMDVLAPATQVTPPAQPPLQGTQDASATKQYEIQELKADLGQQVQAGQLLCTLSNHHYLAIEGRAFRDETPFLERAVKEHWPIHVDFQEPEGSGWPATTQVFHIQYLANTIDPVNRTFAFRLPLTNESRMVRLAGTTQTLWRFRPGQKLRLLVPIEQLNNVWIVPRDAVTRDGMETILFTQNVNTFVRKPVKVLLTDRTQAILAADETTPAGIYIAQNAAAQLYRMLKSNVSGVPTGYHMHADGSLHKNGDD